MKIIIKFLFVSLLFCTPAKAEVKVLGKWLLISIDNDIRIAKTINESGEAIGLICVAAENSCNSYIDTGASCDVDKKYPLILNSAIGASPGYATCVTFENNKYLIFENFDEVVQVLESGGQVGVAIPMVDGKFSILIFNTEGATLAMREARQPFLKNPKTMNSKNKIL